LNFKKCIYFLSLKLKLPFLLFFFFLKRPKIIRQSFDSLSDQIIVPFSPLTW